MKCCTCNIDFEDREAFKEHMKLHRQAKEQARKEVSDEHPFYCVCGRLCTGLHELHCAKFRTAVDRREKKIFKKLVNSSIAITY